MKRVTRAIWKRKDIRAMDIPLAEMYGGACAWCRESGAGNPDKDHAIAHSKTADDSFDNIWHLCPNCHRWSKPVVELFLGEQALHRMRDLWRSWHGAKSYLINLGRERAFSKIAEVLPQLHKFIVYCGTYRDVCEFFEPIILQDTSNISSEIDHLALIRIRCFVAQLWDRCGLDYLGRAEFHLRNAILSGEQLLGKQDEPIVMEARVHLAHTLTKRETNESRREAIAILNGDNGPILPMENALLNRMHLHCKAGEHDAVLDLFKQHQASTAQRFSTTAYAIVGSSFFQKTKNEGYRDDEVGRSYDEDSFRIGIGESCPREILLRCFDLQRSWEKQSVDLGAEALLLARAFKFAATGLDPSCRKRLEPWGHGLRPGVIEAENKLKHSKSIARRYKHIIDMVGSRFNHPNG